MSQTQRNEKARKRFFSWWGAELKKFVKDAQDMIKDAEMAERVSKESVFGKDAQDMIRDAEKEVDDQADIERIRERL